MGRLCKRVAYDFVTRWQVAATPAEVFDIFADPARLPQWWPAVYLDCQVTQRSDTDVQVRLWTKGWLPYTLQWHFRPTEFQRPDAIALHAQGDFIGVGRWTFTANERGCEVIYRWNVQADKGLLKLLTPLLRPVFEANHRWAMAKGRESLMLELARRRALTDDARRSVPAPPGPTFPHNIGLFRDLQRGVQRTLRARKKAARSASAILRKIW